MLIFVVVPDAFGLWKFAVMAVDAEGNPQSEELLVIERLISGIEPEPLASMAIDSYDAEIDQVTLTVS